ncbi:MAG: tyrosine-type recombinase/integrase, partial [Desulfobacteraceae bacterium]|nr:tyrosine-type recombinase/integrase [Desulfobacteraceae bacterium]
MNDQFKPYIDELEQYLKIRNFAKRTIDNTCWKIDKFTAYLKQNNIFNIDHITKKIIRSYQIELYQMINAKGIQNSVGHQNNMLSAVRQFTRFLYERDYIVSDPARDIQYAKIPKTLPRSILTKTEAKRIIHAPDIKTALGYRDRVILEVLYTSGIRKQEIIQLILNDVDYHDGILKIENGKGGKDRIVPLGRIACRYLENYIKSVRPELIKDPYNNHLFLSLKGNRL